MGVEDIHDLPVLFTARSDAMNTGNYLHWAPMITALAAVLALVWQINREIRSAEKNELEVKRAAKIKIVSDLVAHRFVLTPRGSRQNRREAELAFDTALCRIPIDFIGHDEVLRKYRELGNSFTAEKYHDLIKTMIEAAGHRVPTYFTSDLLANVPTMAICPK